MKENTGRGLNFSDCLTADWCKISTYCTTLQSQSGKISTYFTPVRNRFFGVSTVLLPHWPTTSARWNLLLIIVRQACSRVSCKTTTKTTTNQHYQSFPFLRCSHPWNTERNVMQKIINNNAKNGTQRDAK